MGTREAAAELDFSSITLDQDVEDALKEAAVISMGTEISLEDMTNIVELCDQACALPSCLAGIFIQGLHVLQQPAWDQGASGHREAA